MHGNLAALKAEALVAAKRSGLDAASVVFSNKLEWIDDGGRVALRKARVDRGARRIVLYLDAMRARWDERELQSGALGVLGECIAALKRRAPATLYVHRPLLNADEVIAWAKATGFSTTLLPGDMHVTVAYSKKPMDWDKAGEAAVAEVIVPAGQDRSIEQLGDDGAVALRFESPALAKRWQDIRDAGASWDHPSYKPHVTLSYDGPDDLAGIPPYTGRLVFGPEVFAKITPQGEIVERLWDEEDHPRVPAGSPDGGQFTFAGGGGPTEQPSAEEIAESLVAQQKPEDAEPPPNPEVINVGGDEWNRQTALRLEREYAAVRRKLDRIVDDAVGGEVATGEEPDYDDAPYVPEEWDMLSNADQESALDEYKKKTYDDYYNSEYDNWVENDGPGVAMSKVIEEFNNGEEDWAREALGSYLADKAADGEPLPYDVDNLIAAMELEFEQNYSSKPIDDVEVDFNESKLKPRGDLFAEGQQTIPGIELPEKMSGDARDELIDVLKEALKEAADEVYSKGDLEAPDYLSDSVSEFQEESWNSMDGSDKFSWVKAHTDMIESYESQLAEWEKNQSDGTLSVDSLPQDFDPLGRSSGPDYVRTRAVMTFLARERAVQVLTERGLAEDNSTTRVQLRELDHKLWTDWKGSSHSHRGSRVLQIAAAEELQGRLRLRGGKGGTTKFERDDLVNWADRVYSDIGGYNGVKAYVRAKWEATQYALDRADEQTIKLYRGVTLENVPTGEKVTVGKREYEQLPDVRVERNGLISTTTDVGVANNWGRGPDHVVLRFEVPRTAVLSVPAYGINVHGEHEVVVAGTAYKAWDAWKGTAPLTAAVPIAQ